MNLSVVVPTFNRRERLTSTLTHLLHNEIADGQETEIVVVDDGSAVPAVQFLPTSVPAGFSLRVLRQENSGPAKARNLGFRASRGAIVLFVDDDILAPPDLLRRHVEAHRAHPSSVVFGRCVYAHTTPADAFRAYLSLLSGELAGGSPDELQPISTVASGQISVERTAFSAEDRVYREGLATPAAEEFELAWRLRSGGIPILFAPLLVAIHDQPATLPAICQQQYKYGIGCAETWVKCPDARDMPELRLIMTVNPPPRPGDSGVLRARKSAKRLAALAPSRRALTAIAGLLERVAPTVVLHRAYSMVLGAHFVAGIRDGLRRFGPVS